MSTIKFGTDGWRAIIAQQFTTYNVKRIGQATAWWIKRHYPDQPSVVIGHDCRFGGDLFAKTAAQILAYEGVKVFLAEGFASTPMVALGTVQYKADAGIVITASHNPPIYNGFKIKANYGGPAVPSMIQEVEDLIPDYFDEDEHLEELEQLVENDQVTFIDLESLYVDHAEKHFDMEAIRNSDLKIAYDAMYGTGQNAMKRLLPDSKFVNCHINPSFNHTPPEPIVKNLGDFAEMIKSSNDIDAGLATDGDADRLGMFNSKGEFVDSHHIILLLINYLYNHKSQTGKVITSFSCTSKVKAMCEKFGLDHIVTKIGFKHICDVMLNQDEPTLVGGEESGGITIKDHIPERDGIWVALAIFEFMAKTGKSLDELIQEVYEVVGPFSVERNDLHIKESQKQKVMQQCQNNEFNAFGIFEVQDVEDVDGYKFHLGEDQWVMIRPSGTEPVLRTYAEAPTREEALHILKETEKTIAD